MIYHLNERIQLYNINIHHPLQFLERKTYHLYVPSSGTYTFGGFLDRVDRAAAAGLPDTSASGVTSTGAAGSTES